MARTDEGTGWLADGPVIRNDGSIKTRVQINAIDQLVIELDSRIDVIYN